MFSHFTPVQYFIAFRDHTKVALRPGDLGDLLFTQLVNERRFKEEVLLRVVPLGLFVSALLTTSLRSTAF